uniref:Rho GTPase-activating protein 20 n=1 Tax=Austrofundulus limnaeus TaxID=52670 RepID=A0A2I4BEJ6_AUSLI
MDTMSPQQQQSLDQDRGGGQQEHKPRMRFQSYRRQSAPSSVITKALTRSKTVSRDSFLVPVCPETCPLVRSLLTIPDRTFLLYGHAQLKTGMQTQDRHLFLFTDILVIAKAKSANHFKQKLQVSVCEMWIGGCTDEVCEGSTNPERSFVLGWPTWNCVAVFSSAEQKERWLSILKSRIKAEKENEEPKTIPLRVYGKGLNTFAVTKTLPVSNSDLTNEVIRLALQQFGIIGTVKDFQLWVVSRRDNTPYPLIGHEFPFSIQMSHVRNSDPTSTPADRQEQVNKDCQFILRPRPAEPPRQHEPADFSQKAFKRRRSLITWAFWRGSSPHLNEPLVGGAARGRLFGQPLSSVCMDDALPKPVMDMLGFLYHEGSWTRGIFRRPAGARSVRDLRDSLDSGESQLPLSRDHIFIVAGVFKDFLRSIPGSLLGCELFEEWMDVLEEEEEEEEQVQDIKRMICRLAKENALLLRYLLALLHGIQSNAQENQMTSFNLSVCIAPSLLWPPGLLGSPEVEGEGTKKVCELVKFMIERSPQILGEEPSVLFGGPPRRPSSDETGPESWVYPLTDSSYDSLENELDAISGGSPSSCSKRPLHFKALQSSLESILTFSDYDQDADPEALRTKTHGLPGIRIHLAERRRRPKVRAEDTSPTLDSLSLEGAHLQQQRRRRSEPAIAYAARFCPHISGSADGLAAGDEGSQTLTQTHTKKGYPSAALGASFSSLSSTSPAPTRSSLDSLDSLGTEQSGTLTTDPPCIPPPSPFASGSARTPSDLSNHSKDSPAKDPHHWGAMKGCMGLHPNSWLKKDRRLSLTQQEGQNVDEDDKTVGTEKGTKPKPHRRGSKDAGGVSQHPKPESSLDIVKRRPAQSNTTEQKQPSPSPFHKHSGPSLSLFRRRQTPRPEDSNERLHQRRGSEPGWQVVDRASAFTRARLPSDPGLKLPEPDPQRGATEAGFCLSPCATKVVRDYFSSHPRSSPQSSQQVVLAVAEGRREWLKRCSDPNLDPDLEQLLFSEESYV